MVPKRRRIKCELVWTGVEGHNLRTQLGFQKHTDTRPLHKLVTHNLFGLHTGNKEGIISAYVCVCVGGSSLRVLTSDQAGFRTVSLCS